MSKKTFYGTTPIYYPSDKLHIGHALTTTMVDALTRYKKAKGYETFFLTGSDEHGQKIERVSKAQNMKPLEYTDKIVASFKNLWEKLDIEYSDFLRTTEPRHYQAVQGIFAKIFAKGDIYMAEYEGLYCTSCETFFSEHQLKDGCCPDCGKEVEVVKEESYFFKMSKYADRLLAYIEEHPEFIKPESRKTEMVNFVKQGLEDLCISRTTFDWGIPLPVNDKHVMYVWFDALTNYLTALDYLNDGELYEKFWVNNDEIVHFVGKDIVRFHTIIWPIILMAADIKIPTTVFAHGWLLQDGDKMSKSKGNVVDPLILMEKYGSDALRYFLLREMPYGSDGYYSEENLVSRINVDLANDYGNLLSRTISMIDKYFQGIVKEPQGINKDEDFFKELVAETVKNYTKQMDNFEFSQAMQSVFKMVSRGNKYIEEQAPWVLAKENKTEELAWVMYNLVEVIRIATILLAPVLVKTKKKVMTQLGLLDERYFAFEALNFGAGPFNYQVHKGEPLFPRIDPKEALKVVEEPVAVAEAAMPTNLITIDEFFKGELRVGEILSAEKVPKADKLLLLKVLVGAEETRTIVAGIASFYSPEDLLGKKIIVVYNLKPAKLRGILSEGMLLAAKEGSELRLLTVDGPIKAGAVVG